MLDVMLMLHWCTLRCVWHSLEDFRASAVLAKLWWLSRACINDGWARTDEHVNEAYGTRDDVSV